MTSTSPSPSRFLNVHVLQPVPFSSLNRDDLGNPKTVSYGGVTRMRVSSQCWKRQVRLMIEAATGDSSVRTRRCASAVSSRLRGRGWPDELADFAGQQVLTSAGKGGVKFERDREGGLSAVLLWLPESALDGLADLAADHRPALEKALGKKTSRPALPTDEVARFLTSRTGTVSLFGRMLAELPEGNVDGAVQVAHAFTVHAAEAETDYFAAADDLARAADRGSGHLASGEFAAGLFYRYTCVDLAGLIGNLGGDLAVARRLTDAFLTAFAVAMPTGKQTATAPNTLPDLVYAAVRGDRPVSLAGAFETPVRPDPEGGGYARPARAALGGYAAALNKMWGADGIVVDGYAGVDAEPVAGLGERHGTFRELAQAALDAAYPDAGAPA